MRLKNYSVYIGGKIMVDHIKAENGGHAARQFKQKYGDEQLLRASICIVKDNGNPVTHAVGKLNSKVKPPVFVFSPL